MREKTRFWEQKRKRFLVWPVDGTLGTGIGRGDYHWHGGVISPTLDPSEGKARIPALLELPILFTIKPWTMGEMWKRAGDWFESRQWKNKLCIHPLSPKPPFCAPDLMINGPAFPFQAGRPPLTVAMAMQTAPRQLKKIPTTSLFLASTTAEDKLPQNAFPGLSPQLLRLFCCAS